MKSRFAVALIASFVPALAMAQQATTSDSAKAATPAASTHASVTAKAHASTKAAVTYTPKISADSAKAIALGADKDAKVVSNHLVYAYHTHYYKIRLLEGKKHEYTRVNAEDGSLFTVPSKASTSTTSKGKASK